MLDGLVERLDWKNPREFKGSNRAAVFSLLSLENRLSAIPAPFQLLLHCYAKLK
jgi:hypothetical protein